MTTVQRLRPHNAACICAGCQALRREKSPRSVNLYGLASAGPAEAAGIRERWRALGGYIGGAGNFHMGEAELLAAVRAGRIRL